jgi:RND family efflux transporter MFP subunit
MTRSSFLLVGLLLSSCTSAGGAEAPPAPPPVSVSTIVLETKTVEETSDYLAALASRRAVNLHPQVSGYVRAITVTPGTTVKAGAVLLQIDASAEQAALQNLVATRESLAVSASFAKQRLERSTNLRTDGIVSQENADQARATADQAEASLRATDALIASQRARVGFFSIVAPFDGVVGHVPVKVGDFVTPAMPLTSLTQDAGLEAEVWVPVEKVRALSASSRLRLLDEAGQPLAESALVFISPRADPLSQLVLIKGAYASNAALRSDQLVRARVVWSQAPGLMLPATAVMREAGQPFAFVVEAGKEPGNTGQVVRRVPVTLGALQGGEYVLVKGLDAGHRVVVSGVQLVHDGSPVQLSAQAKEKAP